VRIIGASHTPLLTEACDLLKFSVNAGAELGQQ